MRFVSTLLLCLLAACAPSRSGEGPATTTSVAEALGRVVIDTRKPKAFAAGHASGAINIQLGWDQLEDRIEAYVPDQTTPLALRTTSASEARAALATLRERGYRDVILIEPGKATETLELWTAKQLAARLAGPTPPVVIDVRSRAEYERGTIPGALLFEQDEAPSLVGELDRQAEYAVICEGGYRSSQLASLMRKQGFARVINVIDGMAAWNALER